MALSELLAGKKAGPKAQAASLRAMTEVADFYGFVHEHGLRREAALALKGAAELLAREGRRSAARKRTKKLH